MTEKAKKTKGKRSLAVVMSGGGMRCVYGAGVLAALVEVYGLTEPDIVIAVSGSAGGGAYYLAGQYRHTISTMLALLSGSRFISFRRRKILDIDYLVDDIFKKVYPLNFETLRRRRTTFAVCLTRVRDGATVYLEPPRDERIYEYLRAAKAVPIAYGSLVPIGSERYVDGDCGADTIDLVAEATRRGADDVIVIESNPGGSGKSLSKTLLNNAIRLDARLRREKGLARAARRELARRPSPTVLPKGTLVEIAPRKNPVSFVTTRKLALRMAFNRGYEDAAGNEKLRQLLAARG